MTDYWAIHSHRDSDTVGLEWSFRICVSSRFPGDANAGGPGTALTTSRVSVLLLQSLVIENQAFATEIKH